MKVKRYCWRLALCFVLGFSIIFGSTLSVNASAVSPVFTFTSTSSSSWTFALDNVNVNTVYTSNNATYQVTKYTNGGYNINNFTYNLNFLTSDSNIISVIDPNKYYRCDFTGNLNYSGANTNHIITHNGSYFEDFRTGRITGVVNNYMYFRGSDLLFQGGSSAGFNVLVHSNLRLAGGLGSGGQSTCTVNLSASYTLNFYEVSAATYNSSSTSSVSDTGTQNAINNQTSKVEEGNQIAQENSDTNKDTNNKITDFFSGFFDNLVHIFVPEDGFFSSWFNELNDFFAAKLGFLYAPFDFIISFFNGVLNTIGIQEHGFTIPALSWEGTEFCPEVHFSFDMFAEEFPQLQEAVYFFSDVVIILALMRGIRAKLDLVMGVHEE